MQRGIYAYCGEVKWSGMTEEVPPDVRDSQGPMVRLAPQVASAGLIRDPSQLRGELAGTRPSQTLVRSPVPLGHNPRFAPTGGVGQVDATPRWTRAPSNFAALWIPGFACHHHTPASLLRAAGLRTGRGVTRVCFLQSSWKPHGSARDARINRVRIRHHHGQVPTSRLRGKPQ